MTATELSSILSGISSAAATISTAMDRQTAVIADLTAFLIHGPEYKEIEFQSAEEDKIDDSAGVYATDEQAKQDILQQWRDDGYPQDVIKYFE